MSKLEFSTEFAASLAAIIVMAAMFLWPHQQEPRPLPHGGCAPIGATRIERGGVYACIGGQWQEKQAK